MSIRIFCPCGADITGEISTYDRKTRSVHWFEANARYCRACRARAQAAANARYPKRDKDPGSSRSLPRY